MYQPTTAPAGCTKLYDWCDRNGEPVREFIVSSETVQTESGDVVVTREGTETRAGVSYRTVLSGAECVELTDEQVRTLTEAAVTSISHDVLRNPWPTSQVGASRSEIKIINQGGNDDQKGLRR